MIMRLYVCTVGRTLGAREEHRKTEVRAQPGRVARAGRAKSSWEMKRF